MPTEPAAAGAIENSIEIDAPPARVWEVISEVRNATQWSSQAWKIFPLGGRTATQCEGKSVPATVSAYGCAGIRSSAPNTQDEPPVRWFLFL